MFRKISAHLRRTKYPRLNHVSKSKKIIILIVFILLIEVFLYYNTSLSLDNYYYSYKTYDLLKLEPNTFKASDKENELQNILNGIENTIKDSNIKLFKNFIRFNISVENSFEVKDVNNNQDIITQISIDKDGKYIEVKTGQKKKLLENLNFPALKKIEPNDFIYRLIGENVPQGESLRLFFKDTESIKFHIELSLWSLINFIVFFIIAIPITWGIFLLLNSISKSVFNKPLIKNS